MVPVIGDSISFALLHRASQQPALIESWPCVADPSVAARLASLEQQQQLDYGLAQKLYDNVFRYSESKITRSTNKELKGRLQAAYGKAVKGEVAFVHQIGALDFLRNQLYCMFICTFERIYDTRNNEVLSG